MTDHILFDLTRMLKTARSLDRPVIERAIAEIGLLRDEIRSAERVRDVFAAGLLRAATFMDDGK